MAVLPILELPHPVLRQRAKKVRKIDASVLRLAHDMVETLADANGVGLAANQVGALRRVIVIRLHEEDEETRIYINPEIVLREGEREVEEGCLSIPGYKGLITRSVWVKFSALDHTSKLVKLKADGLLSQALEHEVDHLNGILYLDHLKEHDTLWSVDEDHDTESDDQEGGARHSGSQQEGNVQADEQTAEAPELSIDLSEASASLKIR